MISSMDDGSCTDDRPFNGLGSLKSTSSMLVFRLLVVAIEICDSGRRMVATFECSENVSSDLCCVDESL